MTENIYLSSLASDITSQLEMEQSKPNQKYEDLTRNIRTIYSRSLRGEEDLQIIRFNSEENLEHLLLHIGRRKKSPYAGYLNWNIDEPLSAPNPEDGRFKINTNSYAFLSSFIEGINKQVEESLSQKKVIYVQHMPKRHFPAVAAYFIERYTKILQNNPMV